VSLSMLSGLESSTPLLMVVLPPLLLPPPPLSPPQAKANDTQKQGKSLMIRMISILDRGIEAGRCRVPLDGQRTQILIRRIADKIRVPFAFLATQLR
jgi:hypothetical protein